MTTDLYPHQKDAVEKLLQLKVGALFMEMGTGKTRTAIELVIRRREKIDRCVWFCPVSLKRTIQEEIRTHINEESYSFNNKTNIKSLPHDCFWYIVGIESMSSSDRVILTTNSLIDERTFVIVDESSFIKNQFANRSRYITDISTKSRYKLILSGTPITNSISDIYSQMKFLSPKILGYTSFYSFSRYHLVYSKKYPNLVERVKDIKKITDRSSPFIYQITKDECLDLPDKIHKVYYFDLDISNRVFYNTAKTRMLNLIDYENFNSHTIFCLFDELRKVSSGICTEYDEYTKEKTIHNYMADRLYILSDIINKIPQNEKIIIWSCYKYNILEIIDYLTRLYGPCVTSLYGDINPKDRDENIQSFKTQDDIRFLIVSYGCGSFGFTLNESRYVIFFNSDFKYSNRIQSEDRCHRIGQTKTVTYIDIVAERTIDEYIRRCLIMKVGVINQFSNTIHKSQTEQEIKTILEVL